MCTSKTITVQSFDLLSLPSKHIAIENYRNNDNNFLNFLTHVQTENIGDFKDEVKTLGLSIDEFSFKVHVNDGCSYKGIIDLKTLLSCDFNNLNNIYPDQYRSIKKDHIIIEEIEPLIEHDNGFFHIEYFCSGIYRKAVLNITARENALILNSWRYSLTDYIHSVFYPINRGLLKEVQDSYCYSRSWGAIEDYFMDNDILFTHSGLQIDKADLEG